MSIMTHERDGALVLSQLFNGALITQPELLIILAINRVVVIDASKPKEEVAQKTLEVMLSKICK